MEKSNSTFYSYRWQALDSVLETNQLNALVLNPGPSLVYFTGLHFHLSERPVVCIYIPGKEPILVLPELELAKTQGLPYQIRTYPYGEDPAQWAQVFRHAVQQAELDGKPIGVEPRGLRLLEFRLLINSAPEADFISAETSIAALRMRKDPSEILAMRKAVEIAQNALQALLPVVNTGVTEHELASELTLQLLRNGSDPAIPFSPIVSSGPNAANPHATPSDRQLIEGDLLVIDWGASYQGYFSDITRTFAIGQIDRQEQLIGQVVLQANAAGRAAVAPGVTAHQVDQAARAVIENAGYGSYFTHRTGHGLGMEGHEEPYIRSGSDFRLSPGMTFTIEPGIYLPGRNGIRIEDDVVVTDAGVESLTTLPREVVTLG
jgi:Xaa-Pro dipeptidase